MYVKSQIWVNYMYHDTAGGQNRCLIIPNSGLDNTASQGVCCARAREKRRLSTSTAIYTWTFFFSAGMRLLVVLAIAVAANALHFYLDTNQKRCFIEELPTDTVAEGMLFLSS